MKLYQHIQKPTPQNKSKATYQVRTVKFTYQQNDLCTVIQICHSNTLYSTPDIAAGSSS
jgi:hypothetical protein